MAFEKICGMDYELGSKKLPWKDWQAIEEGRMKKSYLPDNPVFKILREEWSSQLAGHSS